MLHRAANNAYSWWWAGHIRTKQSKWLEQNLQDMEEKVKYMLKLIEEDGDSFAKRAEMYYRRRPELINFVEESYRAYRALAERYDHISGDLQNANHTIATVFPEQVQLAMDDEEQYGSQNTHAHSIDPRKLPERLPEVPKANIPSVPKFLNKAIQGSPALTTKKVRLKKTDTTTTTTNSSSQISKNEALEEIDKLQKGILALQTEKEFVKSSYESRLAKYWEIEKSITEMQEKVGGLQDEFSVCTVIEDNDARTLMAATALKSCQETLVQLQEKQERSVEEAEVEYQRIKDAHEKLETIKDKFVHNGKDQTLAEKEFMEANPTLKNLEQSELIREKIREHFEMNSDPSLTVTELAEKIDELVTKVISLETAVSSQTALIERLRSETNELQAHLQGLEEDKTTTTMKGSNNLSKKLRELEEELCVIQGLNRNVDDQNSNLQTHFTEAHCNLGHLSEKLQSMKHPDEEINGMDPVEAEKGLLKQEDMVLPPDDGSSLCVKDREGSLAQPKSSNDLSEKNQELKMRGEAEIKDSSETEGSVITLEPQEPSMDREDLPTHFTEAHCNLGHLSEKLQSMKHLDNKINVVDPVRAEVGLLKQEDMVTPPDDDLSLCVKDREESPAQPKSSNNISEKIHELKKRDEAEIKDSSETKRSVNTFEPQEPSMDRKDLPTLQELLLHGLEDKEKILLTEYTSILWKYKEAKKRLLEEEKKNQDNLLETTVQVRELKSSNTMKDKEIRSLRQKLNLLQTSSDENTHLTESDNIESRNVPTVNLDHNDEATEGPDESTAEEVEEVKVILINELHTVSTFEEKFRRDIDELLEENLEFWLRFSTSFLQIQKFQTAIQDLQSEFLKLKENMKQKSNNITTDRSLKSDALPIYKHLREIQAELTVWFEQNILLKDELQSRLSSLRKIQEEIVRVSKANSRTKDVKFTGYQAAKFQGEVSNMQQENNKVANELQAGLDRVRGLQIEMEKTLSKMDEDFKLSESKNHHPQMKYSTSRTRVPLRSFIFGVKSKKHKPSIFSCMSPALQRQYSDLKGNLPI